MTQIQILLGSNTLKSTLNCEQSRQAALDYCESTGIYLEAI